MPSESSLSLKERAEARARNLLQSLNSTAQSARAGWFFFISLTAYLFIAVASVTHLDLLLHTPVKLPILQIEIGLRGFFLVAPVLFLLVYFGVRLHHAMLEQKAVAFNDCLRSLEDPNRLHPIRFEISSYFFVQNLVGPTRSGIFAMLQHGMKLATIDILPVLLTLYFLIAFLPSHDYLLTGIHRGYIVVGVAILLLHAWMRMDTDEVGWRAVRYRLSRVSFFGLGVASSVVIAFSFLVATLPTRDNDEQFDLDRIATALWSTKVPYDWNDERCQDGQRCAFWLTAVLFEQPIDYVSGGGGWFSRNLIVVDNEAVRVKLNLGNKEMPVTLRGRDLRHATLDRIDLAKADLTGSDLSHSSLLEANLQGARLGCADPGIRRPTTFFGQRSQRDQGGARDLGWEKKFDLERKFQDAQQRFLDRQRPGCTDLTGAALARANLSEARLAGAKLRRAKLGGANLNRADLYFASLEEAQLGRADLTGARLSVAQLRNANLSSATLVGATLAHAELQGAKLQIGRASCRERV